MRLAHIDRILEIEPWEHVRGLKTLTLAEEYLKDHFPRFPVMPGALMLEALFQAGSWLIRFSDDFRFPTIVLREAKNLKYSGFVLPGDTLELYAEVFKREDNLTTLKIVGSVKESPVVTGRLVLEQYDLSQRYPACRGNSTIAQEQELRESFALLFPFSKPPVTAVSSNGGSPTDASS